MRSFLALTVVAFVLAPAAHAAKPSPTSANYQQARAAITRVFGPYASQAMRVAGCETGGTYDPRAHNGQYLGIFQMGEYARTKYGHGPSWLVQAAAAYLYFTESGRRWGPWSCGWAAH